MILNLIGYFWWIPAGLLLYGLLAISAFGQCPSPLIATIFWILTAGVAAGAAITIGHFVLPPAVETWHPRTVSLIILVGWLGIGITGLLTLTFKARSARR